MTADRLYRDPALVRFYDLENAGGADLAFCARLAEGAGSVLDLGCGTGEFAARLAGAREVVGVDPAAAMLEEARRRPGGDRVLWVEADARTVRLGRRFGLVALTGHAFQVFLTEADQRAVLSTIAAHLAPGGRFVFDARNPRAEEWREWTPETSRRFLDDPQLGRVEAWNDVAHDAQTGIVTYETRYRALQGGGEWAATSQIRFTGRETLARLMEEAGLTVERWMGDWQGAPFAPFAPEIIPIGRLQQAPGV
jgi:SAM-dependent methyltransferase